MGRTLTVDLRVTEIGEVKALVDVLAQHASELPPAVLEALQKLLPPEPQRRETKVRRALEDLRVHYDSLGVSPRVKAYALVRHDRILTERH